MISIARLVACGDSNMGPPGMEPPKNPRTFTWTVDSVYYDDRQTPIGLRSIWGSSPTDVWGTDGDAPDVRDCLWHYDGTRWTRATEGTPITEPTGNKTVYSVWGSASNDVWTVGRKITANRLSAFIMRYDGSSWYDATPPSVDSIQSVLYTIYGRGSNDIWAAGYEYAIHYDGANWTKYKVADSMIVPHMSGNSDFVYATAYSPWGRNVSILLVFRGDHFQVIDSTNQESDAKFGSWLWVQSTKLTTFSNGVISTTINADGTVPKDMWWRELTTVTYFGPPSVQDPLNVLAVGQFNLIYHFNGVDWAPVAIGVPNHMVSPYAFFSGVWLTDSEAFVCDIDEGIIYHGR